MQTCCHRGSALESFKYNERGEVMYFHEHVTPRD